MGFSGPFSVEEMETNLGPGWEAYVKEVQMDRTVTITNNLFPGTNTAYFEAKDRIFGGVFRSKSSKKRDIFGKDMGAGLENPVKNRVFKSGKSEYTMYWYPLQRQFWQYLGACFYGVKHIKQGRYFGINIRPQGGGGIPKKAKITFRPNFLKVNDIVIADDYVIGEDLDVEVWFDVQGNPLKVMVVVTLSQDGKNLLRITQKKDNLENRDSRYWKNRYDKEGNSLYKRHIWRLSDIIPLEASVGSAQVKVKVRAYKDDGLVYRRGKKKTVEKDNVLVYKQVKKKTVDLEL